MQTTRHSEYAESVLGCGHSSAAERLQTGVGSLVLPNQLLFTEGILWAAITDQRQWLITHFFTSFLPKSCTHTMSRYARPSHYLIKFYPTSTFIQGLAHNGNLSLTKKNLFLFLQPNSTVRKRAADSRVPMLGKRGADHETGTLLTPDSQCLYKLEKSLAFKNWKKVKSHASYI